MTTATLVVVHANEQVPGVVEHLARCGFWFVVESAEAAFPRTVGVELRIQVNHRAIPKDEPEVGIAAPLFLPGGGFRNSTGPPFDCCAFPQKLILNEAARLVDAACGMDRVGWFVEFGERPVEDGSEFIEPGFIGGWIDRDDFFSGSGGEDFAEINALEIAILLQKPADELGSVRFFLLRVERANSKQSKRDRRPEHQKLTLICAPSTRAFGMFPVPPGLMIHWRFGCTYANFVIWTR